jgi:hypothetical protein
VFVTISGDILGKVTLESGWLAGLQSQHRRSSTTLIFEHNASSRDMGIADDRASRWRDGRDAGTQGCKWEQKDAGGTENLLAWIAAGEAGRWQG